MEHLSLLNGHSQDDYLNDGMVFKTFTHVARMLAAEDIAVRYNVLGMPALAQFNVISRVLDVAPIKRSALYLLPGVMIHEVGHGLDEESAQIYAFSAGSVRVNERVAKVIRTCKNGQILNAIEDGIIERRAVREWRGALKHLELVFEYIFKDWDTKKEFEEATDIDRALRYSMRALTYNCKGGKYGKILPYPKILPGSLIVLLKRGESLDGKLEARVDLVNSIVNEFESSLSHRRETPRTVVFRPSGSQLPLSPVRISFTSNTSDAIAQQLDDALKFDAVATELHTQVDDQIGTTNPPRSAKPAQPESVSEESNDDDSVVEIPESLLNTLQNAIAEAVEEEQKPKPFVEETPLTLEQFMSDNKVDMFSNVLDGAIDRTADRKQETEQLLKPQQADEDDYDSKGRVRSKISAYNFPNPEFLFEIAQKVDLLADIKAAPIAGERLSNGLPKSLIRNEGYQKQSARFNKVNKACLATAAQLYAKFKLRVNAINMALVNYKTTGTLDPSRAALFRIYDDVFQRVTMDQHQPNHHYIVMLDWSGSMRSNVYNLLVRVLELAHFSQLAKVRLEVWLYTDASASQVEKNKRAFRSNIGSLFDHVGFCKVLDTEHCSQQEMVNRLFLFFLLCTKVKGSVNLTEIFDTYSDDVRAINTALSFHLGGTYIAESVAFAYALALRSTYEKKVIMTMTDGADSEIFSYAADLDDKGPFSYSANARGWINNVEAQLIEDKKNINDNWYQTYHGRRLSYALNGVNADIAMRSAILRVKRAKYHNDISRAKQRGKELDILKLDQGVKPKTAYMAHVIDMARKTGIQCVGILMDFASAEFVAAFHSNVINMRAHAMHVNNLAKISQADNGFITKMSRALLAELIHDQAVKVAFRDSADQLQQLSDAEEIHDEDFLEDDFYDDPEEDQEEEDAY